MQAKSGQSLKDEARFNTAAGASTALSTTITDRLCTTPVSYITMTTHVSEATARARGRVPMGGRGWAE